MCRMSAAATVRRLILPMTAPVGSVRAVRPNRELAVLTYDDGPQPGGTDKVLAALADARSTATFFILVGRARKHRTLLREVVAAGHEIALHGIDHVRLTTMSPGHVRRRTKDGKHQLEDLAGQQVRWFRPPYGAQRPGTWAAVRSTGLMPVVWSNEVADWQDDTVDQLSERARSVRAGSVLLLHDGYADEFDGVDDGPAPGFDRGELSRRILGELDQRGIATASLGDALAAGTAVRGAWFRG
jgi:peptidoglycan/xylan/chitin deacetylase (PgdA/CDA1 family)